MFGNMGLKLTNDCDAQAPAEQINTTWRALYHNDTSSRLIIDDPAKHCDLDLRANELDAVYQSSKSYLSMQQRHQSWERMIDDVLEK